MFGFSVAVFIMIVFFMKNIHDIVTTFFEVGTRRVLGGSAATERKLVLGDDLTDEIKD